ELERVFHVCHGCRRCVSLCNAFPTLFDLVDASKTMEVDGVDKADYGKVVAQCYLCDLCYQTKCPYVPPHPWNVDFPHLMPRGKVALFVSCYGNHNMPGVVEDLAAVLSHNGIPWIVLEREQCCGMPKLELGDLDAVDAYRKANLPLLFNAVIAGYDVLAPIP